MAQCGDLSVPQHLAVEIVVVGSQVFMVEDLRREGVRTLGTGEDLTPGRLGHHSFHDCQLIIKAAITHRRSATESGKRAETAFEFKLTGRHALIALLRVG